MPKFKSDDPWPQMRDVVSAVATSMRGGRFIEETLESLCRQLGANSAWSTLETKTGGRIHRSRSASMGAAPVLLAKHVTEVLGSVHTDLETVAGKVPYADEGSFAGVPLWSHPTADDRALIGAMYLEFPADEATHQRVLDFLECVGALIGGAIAQQTLIEESRENLRVEKAKDHNEHTLRLAELLAPKSMDRLRDDLMTAIDSKASIMILGESGTGKTHLATAFARASHGEPIVRATLGRADDLNTITSELFGHERGAFSGAVSKRRGLVEHAKGGTLILDEVLSLPPRAQQLLLDFTQFGTYRPLGYDGSEPKRADLRLIAVTNGDIQNAIDEDRFREDLYYRLATVPVVLPPLRDRRADVPEIALCYLNATDARTDWEIDNEALALLTAPHLEWRGNIRELEAVLERARNRARADSTDPVIEARHLDLDGASAEAAPARRGQPFPGGVRDKWKHLLGERESLDALEKEIIEEALAACGGVVLRTARELSVSRTGLMSRMATLEIDPSRFKPTRS